MWFSSAFVTHVARLLLIAANSTGLAHPGRYVRTWRAGSNAESCRVIDNSDKVKYEGNAKA